MKRAVLADQWRYLNDIDLATLNVGRGTIEVFDDATQKYVPFRLTQPQIDMVKYAYERGLKHLPLY